MKRYLLNATLGALAGIAVQYLAAIVISTRLQLGYLMAYISPLAEALHGEMPAVMMEAVLSGLLGMSIALAISFARQKTWPMQGRCAAAGVSLLAGCLPVLLLTVQMLYGLV